MILEFRVFGEAIPQGSMKGFVHNGRAMLTSDNPRLAAWRRNVAASARVAMGRRRRTLEALRVSAVFYLPRPKSLPRRERDHVHKPDVDKCLRAVLDGLTGIVYRDDAQVVELAGWKEYTTAAPWVAIEVESVAAPALLEARG